MHCPRTQQNTKPHIITQQPTCSTKPRGRARHKERDLLTSSHGPIRADNHRCARCRENDVLRWHAAIPQTSRSGLSRRQPRSRERSPSSSSSSVDDDDHDERRRCQWRSRRCDDGDDDGDGDGGPARRGRQYATPLRDDTRRMRGRHQFGFGNVGTESRSERGVSTYCSGYIYIYYNIIDVCVCDDDPASLHATYL